MRSALASLALLTACGVTGHVGEPQVSVVFDQPGVPLGVQHDVATGASAWLDLHVGYLADISPSLPDCPLDWYDSIQSDCALVVHVTFEAGSTLGASGLTDHVARTTIIQYELQGDQRIETVAHEIGHSLWNTSDHLASGAIGIMSQPSSSYLVTDADRVYVSDHADGWQ